MRRVCDFLQGQYSKVVYRCFIDFGDGVPERFGGEEVLLRG